MAEIPRNNTGLSGEYFVAAELYRRGWSVGMTIGNAKAVDLFAEKEDIIVQVQVKSIYKRKHNGWPMMRDQIKKGCMYVFVNLNGDTLDNPAPAAPDYFICTSEEASEKMDQYSTRGIMPITRLAGNDYQNRWDKLRLKARPA
jgi:hypothetical protein